MQVCQWQLVQINPAARALALGGFRGTGAGAAGGAGRRSATVTESDAGHWHGSRGGPDHQ